ncbi:hypothetical protein F9K50_06120 [bacterium]|nr:MAG: hypothetical protein F9K50_06120 [bacterium]
MKTAAEMILNVAILGLGLVVLLLFLVGLSEAHAFGLSGALRIAKTSVEAADTIHAMSTRKQKPAKARESREPRDCTTDADCCAKNPEICAQELLAHQDGE